MKLRPCNKPLYNPKLRNRRNDSCLIPCIAPDQWWVGRDHGYGHNNGAFRGKRHQKNVVQSWNIHPDCVHYETSEVFRWNNDCRWLNGFSGAVLAARWSFHLKFLIADQSRLEDHLKECFEGCGIQPIIRPRTMSTCHSRGPSAAIYLLRPSLRSPVRHLGRATRRVHLLRPRSYLHCLLCAWRNLEYRWRPWLSQAQRPLSSNSFTTSRCPLVAAEYNGVHPSALATENAA